MPAKWRENGDLGAYAAPALLGALAGARPRLKPITVAATVAMIGTGTARRLSSAISTP
jgi:hypothetical protein